ncbi:flagellar assembly protein FliH [Psychromonas marina]|uniref:Flagellar assembly protein FliH n=1 Tax=Psychromonas marina TaxID=88364 RepID=A0ABQ6DWD5_9GAMM|nr:flagellar assembly protein FliH [Psychromonas marina]GLS89463.1 flagellar assembly protein FliH [Psychromonas marina]
MTDNRDEFQSWSIPELSETERDEPEESSLFGKPATWYNNRNKAVEEIEEDVEEQPKPLTLDDIEAIRQSAYEDGFNEGKENGHQQGVEEGKLEGLATGHQEGLAQGIEEGLAQGTKEIEEQVKRWTSLLDRLHNPLEKLDANAEYQLVHLATSLAEQITRCEIQTSPKIILQALKQAVDALPISEQKLSINLHPEDLKFVLAAYSQEQCIHRGWDLQAEPALMRGDCQINTQVSSVDFAFNTRIDQVLKRFFKENYQHLPEKNDNSSLINDQPMPVESNTEQEEVEALSYA